MKPGVPMMLAGMLLWIAMASGQDAQPDVAGSTELDHPSENGHDLWSRDQLTGNWRGVRDSFNAAGLTVAFDATYIFQGVAAGGFDGPSFDRFSDEGQAGNTISGDLRLELDTGKSRLWPDGLFSFRLEGRAGRSVLERAGTVSAVNNDALFPNVLDDFDRETLAITALTYQHALSETMFVFGGLMNTAEGDENELAGSALSNSHFFNSALLYSLVEDATVPNVSLGGGIGYEPSEMIAGSFSVLGTTETAGEDPFDLWNGTTFSTEWTFAHNLIDREGAQTFGFLYGIHARRTDIAADPRVVIASILLGRPIPTTEADTWSFYYNAHQFIHGDADGGWGVFARFGISDGNPNLVQWNAAVGVGGTGLFRNREQDGWGLGTFVINMSDEDLLQGLGVGDEFGGEVYYRIEVTPWFHFTMDTQVIDSALPGVATTCVAGVRTHIDF